MNSQDIIKIFFGAGRIGRRALQLWRRCGMDTDFFCDNSPELHGKSVEGVEVISIEEILRFPQKKIIFITCKDEKMVIRQLMNLGIEKNQIIRCNTVASRCESVSLFSDANLHTAAPTFTDDVSAPDIIFDLSMGLVLGGVETWSIQTAERLERMGWSTALLVDGTKPAMHKNDLKIISTRFDETIDELKILENLFRLFMKKKGTYLICNFMTHFFYAACMAKKLFPDRIHVITVIHSDAEVFYQDCSDMEPYMDQCLVISEKMRSGLLERNFPTEKIKYLPWYISFDEPFHHAYSLPEEPIRIGYAGRIVVDAKRADYIILLAKKLKIRNIRFILELAGTGTYEEELKQEIKENNLSGEMYILGMLDHSKIQQFWLRQDIMIGCSDYEGHSISQCEAMAAGAVPVITDTSGARDDVENGINGFVVAIGAIDEMADRICFLYEHRDLLPVMGKKAYVKMRETNSGDSLKIFWKTMLESEI